MTDSVRQPLAAAVVTAGMFAACVTAGCESPEAARVLGQAGPAQVQRDRSPRGGRTPNAEEERHRGAYQTTRDPRALRWLLSRRIENGMTREEVDRVIGEAGETEMAGAGFKRENKGIFADDMLVRYGPDADGSTIYLVFRENRLVQFEPREYRVVPFE
jgi:hypothetical protein